MSEEPSLFLVFVTSFVGQAAGYFAVVGLLFLVVWRWGKARFAPRRIQAKERVDRAQLFFETKNTVLTLLFGAGTALGVSALHAAGMTRLSSQGEAFTPWGLAATFAALLVVADAWFYAAHRLLHSPRLYKAIHVVHHKSVDVNPFSSYSFHPVEAVVLSIWIVPFVMLVPVYVPLLGVVQGIGLANNVMSHLGYEFFPRWYVRILPFRWMTTSTYHNLHHSTLHGNYGLMFRWWDRLFRTEAADYEEVFLRRGEAPGSADRA